MNLLIDSNVILDVLQNRHPNYETSYGIFKICYEKQATGYISTLTFANIVYIMRKSLDADKIVELMAYLETLFNFVDFKKSDIEQAAAMKWKDFEDAIQYLAATQVKAQYIVTRNLKDFSLSEIPAITPDVLLEILNS